MSVTKLAQTVSRGVCWAAALGLSVMMVLTFSDVVLRYFGYPIKGAYDIVGLSGAFAIALPIAYTQVLRGHIGIDFIVARFPKRVRGVIDTVNRVLNIGVYSLLAWQCAVYGKKLWSVGRVSETLKLPIFPFPFVVAVGCALMSVVLVIELCSTGTQLEGK